MLPAQTPSPSSESQIPPETIPDPSDRFVAMDVTRGFAALGILAINLLSFGLPEVARLNPEVSGGFEGLNKALWWVGFLFFDGKMSTIFSMLFGAGLVLQAGRNERIGLSPVRRFYRRMAVLLGIGLLHAYLIWDGDILVIYALCGMIVYPFRRLRPRLLFPIALLWMLPAVVFAIALVVALVLAKDLAGSAASPDENHQPLSTAGLELAELWEYFQQKIRPTPEDVRKELFTSRTEGYLDHLIRKAPDVFGGQTLAFAAFFAWVVGGWMLVGMALIKLGILSGHHSARIYALMAIVGYAIGLPLAGLCGQRWVSTNFDPIQVFTGALFWGAFADLLVSLGHIGMINWLVRTGRLAGLTRRLSAIGRMALTNYLTQSIICTTLFCGWGMGLIGTLDRTGLCGVMIAIWAFQLWISPLWLRRHSQGPAEWLWRELARGDEAGGTTTA